MLKKIKTLAEKKGYAAIEASNRSDQRYFRPGLDAVKELGMGSPLIAAGFEKTDIRNAARRLGLANWNKPSTACLASRIPYGVKIDHKTLRRIEKAEACLMQHGFSQVRVRDHFPVARIEIAETEFKKMIRERRKIASELRKLHYDHVTLDLDGYSTGSFDRR